MYNQFIEYSNTTGWPIDELLDFNQTEYFYRILPGIQHFPRQNFDAIYHLTNSRGRWTYIFFKEDRLPEITVRKDFQYYSGQVKGDMLLVAGLGFEMPIDLKSVKKVVATNSIIKL